jgi:predicted O-linked N-acetylglucosamine transferase (SPINDLY family)
MAIPQPLQQSLAHMNAGRYAEAEKIARSWYERHPSDPNAPWLLTATLHRLHRNEQAVFFCEKAVAALPNDSERRLMYCHLLRGTKAGADRYLSEARRGYADFPGDLRFMENLAHALKKADLYSEGIELQLKHAHDEPTGQALVALAGELSSAGRHEEADTTAQRGLSRRVKVEGLSELQPGVAEPRTMANLCFAANAWSHISAERLFEMHRGIGERFDRFRPLELGPLPSTPEPGRRIRLGYMTGDAKTHSVAFFFDALLRHADHARFEVFLYRNVTKGDDTTRRFVEFADQDRILTGLNELQAAQMMRRDKIDILVDLSGLTAGSGVWMMRSRVAPLQGTYLGYCNTTGIYQGVGTRADGSKGDGGVDFRLVDAITDPPGPAPQGSDHLAVERLVRIEGCFICYRPGEKLISPAWKPSTDGTIRLANFNAIHKTSQACFDVWAEILKREPRARLTLKQRPYCDAQIVAWTREQFARRGADPAQVEILSRIEDQADHLSVYNRVDIALDPWPYNGTTTTCELLMMGVPPVCMLGDRHGARVGASIVTAVGCPELIAQSPQEYADKVIALGNDAARLARYRATLRERALGSTLCDAKGFARRVEARYAELWEGWCAAQKGGAER